MKVCRRIEDLPALRDTVVTIGNYDGVHLGHRRILEHMTELAANIKGETVVLTFFPHPQMVLGGARPDFKMINTPEENLRLFEAAGINHVVIIPFTRAFADQSPEEYIRDFLHHKLHARLIVIGFNHRFGKNREGDIALLKKYGGQYHYQVEEIPRQQMDDMVVSSTAIRQAITAGDIAAANRLLGYPFFLTGKVVKGTQTGRTLGYPTANIETGAPYKLLPANGIYAVKVTCQGKTHNGLLSIGLNPTFENRRHSIEAHLLNFSGDLYGEELQISLIARLRAEEKFNNVEDLKRQMKKDEEEAVKLFKQN